MTKEEREVMRMALERLKAWVDHSDCLEDKQAILAIEKCLANDALEKKAENARELGLDYEPEKTVCPFCSSEWVTAEQHDRKMDRLEQEPVAFICEFYADEGHPFVSFEPVTHGTNTPLYTAPPQRKPLTDEEIILIVAECASSHQHTDIHFARAIEAKLKEKNT